MVPIFGRVIVIVQEEVLGLTLVNLYGLACQLSGGNGQDDTQEEEAVRWGHSTFRQAALLAKEAGVKCLWLTHFSQAMVSPEDSLMNARHVFENAVCGYDGLSIHLKYADS